MRATTLLAIACVAASSAAAQSSASTDWPLNDGSRVRVVALGIGDRARTGTLLSTSPDSMVIQEPTNVAFSVVTKVNVAGGAVVGAGAGTLIGLMIGAAPRDKWAVVTVPSR